MKRLLPILAVLAAFAVSAPSVMADHGKHEHGNKHFDNDDRDNDHNRGWERRGDRDNDHNRGWERRGDYEYHIYDVREGHPPGWSRGRKTGWGDCGMPPGQAKKYGCRTYVYEGRRHYYYQDDRGRIIVRRPVIELHGGVVVH